jgi:2,4-dienoyl-CoA reductase-like NADH-dependent reductase (Old Yellow Enzyme family)
MMPDLFDPISFRSVTLRNRIGVSPMCQYSCEDGLATDWHLVHLGSRAVGGAALVIAEATAVEARGRISPDDLGIWSDSHIAPLARVAGFIHGQGAVPGIQIAHAGRKASTSRPWDGHGPLDDEHRGWQPIGPDQRPFDAGYRVPHAMSLQDIAEVRNSFAAAARRARSAGFEWLELHAAHGYLLHSFYSPLSNSRQDQYGGSFDNRVRLTIETAREVRAAWPHDKPMSVRLSCSDWIEGGWTIEDSVELSKRLKQQGVDVIDCSSGAVAPRISIPVSPGYQVPFAAAIRAQSQIATAAVGLITDPQQADEIIRTGRADIVLLAREMLRDPYWAIHAAKSLGRLEGVRVPPQYGRAM